MELGFALGRAGSRVTVLQSGAHVLPAADGEVRKALLELARDAGIRIRTGARVQRIRPDLTVEAEIGHRSHRFPADVVLVATGRAPNTAGLALERAGVALERGAVRVNRFRQSPSAPHIYAAGDVTGTHQHTPAAWYEGQLAADNALRGNRRAVDFSVFPTATFTIPALAQVGLTEEAARQTGARVAIGRAPFADSSAAGVRAEVEGLVKAVLDKRTGRILGRPHPRPRRRGSDPRGSRGNAGRSHARRSRRDALRLPDARRLGLRRDVAVTRRRARGATRTTSR